MTHAKRLPFSQLVERARQEQLPIVDVSESVLRRLHRQQLAAVSDWSMWAAAAVSVAAAAMVMVIASYQGALWLDPLSELIRPFTLVVQ